MENYGEMIHLSFKEGKHVTKRSYNFKESRDLVNNLDSITGTKKPEVDLFINVSFIMCNSVYVMP